MKIIISYISFFINIYINTYYLRVSIVDTAYASVLNISFIRNKNTTFTLLHITSPKYYCFDSPLYADAFDTKHMLGILYFRHAWHYDAIFDFEIHKFQAAGRREAVFFDDARHRRGFGGALIQLALADCRYFDNLGSRMLPTHKR